MSGQTPSSPRRALRPPMLATARLCRCRRAARLALLALAGFVGSMAAHAADPACQVQSLELPVSMVGTRAVATVGINGTTVPLAVDSGAFYSFLTEAAAAQLKLSLTRNFNLRVEGITGSVVTYTTRVDKLQVLKGEIPRVEFLVGGNEPGAGAMGFIGRNILSIADIEYDLANGAIRFMFPSGDCGKANMAYWAGSTPVSEADLLTDYRNGRTPALRAEVQLNGREVVALFDTGAVSVVSRRAARRAGIEDAAMTPAGSIYGAGRGTATLWTAPFDTFKIGDETIHNNRLRVGDFTLGDADMLLGIDFFLSHRIYFSKKQSKVFFTYNGGPVFALDNFRVASAAGAARSASGAGASTGTPAANASPAASADAVTPVAPATAAVAAATATDPAASGSVAGGAQAMTADQLARRGAASAARHDLDGALADLNRACELEPMSPAWFAQRGTIQEALKHPARALDDFDKAIELDPTQADARMRRAWLRLSAKNRDGAKSDLEALDNTLAPQVQMRLSMATLYLMLDQPRQALAQWASWLAAHPHDVGRGGVLASRCWTRAKLGEELNDALDDCNDAVDSDSKNPGFLSNRGWLELRMGKDRQALADFDRSLENRPGMAWPLYGRGLAKTHLGDAPGGEADLASARKALPDIDRQVTRAGLAGGPAPKS